MSKDESKWVSFGKLGRAKGVNGEIFLDLYNPNSLLISDLEVVRVGKTPEEARTFTIESIGVHSGRHLVHFFETGDMDEAKALTGQEIFVPRSILPPLKPGEYYHCDLLGSEVLTVDGVRLGSLTKIIPTPSNDVYVVEGPEGEKLLPAIPDVICDVDLSEHRISVQLGEEVNAF